MRFWAIVEWIIFPWGESAYKISCFPEVIRTSLQANPRWGCSAPWQETAAGISCQSSTKGVGITLCSGLKITITSPGLKQRLFQSSCNSSSCCLPPSEYLGVYWYPEVLKWAGVLGRSEWGCCYTRQAPVFAACAPQHFTEACPSCQFPLLCIAWLAMHWIMKELKS